MPSLRECAVAAKAKFDEVIKDWKTKGDVPVVDAAREFLFECARKDGWDTARFFLNEFYETNFPLEKLNLVGDNNESVYWIVANDQDIAKTNPNIAIFVLHLGSYGDEKGLADKSDEYYCVTHPETNMELLAEVATDESGLLI